MYSLDKVLQPRGARDARSPKPLLLKSQSAEFYHRDTTYSNRWLVFGVLAIGHRYWDPGMRQRGSSVRPGLEGDFATFLREDG
jgi:hypothetical protein